MVLEIPTVLIQMTIVAILISTTSDLFKQTCMSASDNSDVSWRATL